MRPLNEHPRSEKMFESLGNTIKEEQERLAKKEKWVRDLLNMLEGKDFLLNPFQDSTLVHQVSDSVSRLTKIAGIDGGIVSEAMNGFDLALYRAVGAVFHGIGKKVESEYIPHFDPDPNIFFSPSLQSRQEFNRICTLLRLYVEYEVAKMTIEKVKPTVIFLDGKVTPLSTDFTFSNPSKMVQQAEQDVKQIYRKLVDTAYEHKVLLCGVIKDSRSREFTSALGKILPRVMQKEKLDQEFIKKWPYMLDNMQDSFLSDIVLRKGQRTAWLEGSPPSWLSPTRETALWSCLTKPVEEDQPIRLEMLTSDDEPDLKQASEIALSALYVLCNHGMPVALPTVILEADERTKLSADHLNSVIDQISMTLGVPREHLRKRRFFSSSMSRL